MSEKKYLTNPIPTDESLLENPEIILTKALSDKENTVAKEMAFTLYAVQECIEPNETDIPQIAEYREKLRLLFLSAIKSGMLFGNNLVYSTLGIDSNIKRSWKIGQKGQDYKDFAFDIEKVCKAIKEVSAMNGKLNPILYMFLAKNHDGMVDAPITDDIRQNELGENMTAKEIAEKYTDIIIDD